MPRSLPPGPGRVPRRRRGLLAAAGVAVATGALAAPLAAGATAATTPATPSPSATATPSPTPTATPTAGPTATPAPGARPLLRTAQGLARGTAANGVARWQGLPFAAPPVGDLRWQPPQPAARWTGVRDASAPASPCVQQAYASATPRVPGAEDCLYLNVTVPTGVPKHARLPVLVWIHGGGYSYGQGDVYDASRLATIGKVAVVTVNYRLGALGFLADPALGTADRTAGNYGLLDQQAALRWVQRNAAAFGGDARNVTIAGESAGAGSVCSQIIAPSSQKLFHKAIQQSGACIAPFVTQEAAATKSATFSTTAGCPDAATRATCLRALPASKVAEVGGAAEFRSTWNPIALSTFLPKQPADALAAGAGKGKPRLLGNNADEMTVFYAAQVAAGGGLTPETYASTVRAQFGANADRILAAYPVSAYPTPTHAYTALLTDGGQTFLGSCAHLATAREYTKLAPTYEYHFADPQPPGHNAIPGFPLGAYHASELPYVFTLERALVGEGPPTLTAEQQALSTQMVKYWAAFAHTGSPDRATGPAWPRFRTPADVLQLAPASAGGVRTIDLAAESKCDLWRSVGLPG